MNCSWDCVCPFYSFSLGEEFQSQLWCDKPTNFLLGGGEGTGTSIVWCGMTSSTQSREWSVCAWDCCYRVWLAATWIPRCKSVWVPEDGWCLKKLKNKWMWNIPLLPGHRELWYQKSLFLIMVPKVVFHFISGSERVAFCGERRELWSLDTILV